MQSVESYKVVASILGEERVFPLMFFLGIQPNTDLEQRLLEEGYLSAGYNPLMLTPTSIRKLLYNPAPLNTFIAKACLRAWERKEGSRDPRRWTGSLSQTAGLGRFLCRQELEPRHRRQFRTGCAPLPGRNPAFTPPTIRHPPGAKNSRDFGRLDSFLHSLHSPSGQCYHSRSLTPGARRQPFEFSDVCTSLPWSGERLEEASRCIRRSISRSIIPTIPTQAVDAGVHLAKLFGSKIVGSHVYAAKMHDKRFKQMEAGLPEEYHDEKELDRQRQIHDSLITRGLQIITDSYLDYVDKKCNEANLPIERRSLEGRNWKVLAEDINTNATIWSSWAPWASAP